MQDKDFPQEKAVELIGRMRGQVRADYWLASPFATNLHFKRELEQCLVEHEMEPLQL